MFVLRRGLYLCVCMALLCCALVPSALAVDGIVLIDQAKAMGGNVTPGDAPGFPVSITISGNYRMSSNLTVPNANTSAIVIIANNVTIDMNGFSILGPTDCPTDGFSPTPGCTGSGTGIGIDSGSAGAYLNTRVTNGTINGMGFAGLYLGLNSRVEGLNITSNGSYGIIGSGGLIKDVLIRSNGGLGIYTSGAIVENTRVLWNLSHGMYFTNVTLVNSSVSLGNGGYGLVFNSNARYFNTFVDLNVGGQIFGGSGAGNNTCGAAACP
jgi:hypothetical protein